MQSFNVINYDFNQQKFESYDIMPYLIDSYHQRIDISKQYPNSDNWKVPVTFDEFKKFVKTESQYHFWARCQYEIVLSPWPYISSPSERWDKEGEDDVNAWKEHWKKHLKSCDKWDIFDQIMMNLDIITRILMENVPESN